MPSIRNRIPTASTNGHAPRHPTLAEKLLGRGESLSNPRPRRE